LATRHWSGMAFEPYPEFLTIEQSAAYLNVPQVTIRRLLRQYGMGEFVRAAISRQVLIRRSDLDRLDAGQPGIRRAGIRAPREQSQGAA
jgi:excisionase family DNA binding protein